MPVPPEKSDEQTPSLPHDKRDRHQQKFTNEGVSDNVDFAVYSKLNDLGERFGLRPYDFIASLSNGPGDDMRLEFEDHPNDRLKADKFDRMARALGIPDDSNKLEAPIEQIIDALDKALQHGVPHEKWTRS